jgi:hypothetical protein
MTASFAIHRLLGALQPEAYSAINPLMAG